MLQKLSKLKFPNPVLKTVFRDSAKLTVLTLIAIGLWTNIVVLQLRPAIADDCENIVLERDVSRILGYVKSIYLGTCPNSKVC
jgi:hypothetical protein